MKRIFIRISFICAAVLAANGLQAAELEIGVGLFASPGGVDLYELIGLDKKEYQQNKKNAYQTSVIKANDQMKSKLDQLSNAIATARTELNKAEKDPKSVGDVIRRKKAELEEKKQQLRDVLQERDSLAQNLILKDSTFNSWAKEEIEAKCQKARSKLREDIKEKQNELKLYSTEMAERMRINKEIAEIEKKLEQAGEGCIFLLDPKLRAQYDAKILKAITAEERMLAYDQVRDAVEGKLRLVGTGTRVFLNEFVGNMLSQVSIPGPAATFFNQQLALTDIHVLPKPKGEDIKYYVGFSGTAMLNQAALKIDVYIIWDIYNTMRWMVSATPRTAGETSLSTMFPGFFSWFPRLKFLDSFVFPTAKIAIASFNGIDSEGFSFEKGFNLLGQWDIFSGPLSFFKRLQQAAPKLEGLVFEARPVEFGVQIPWNPLLSKFTAELPLYLGIDFTKIGILPKMFTSVINKLTTDAFKITISPFGRTLEQKVAGYKERLKLLKERLELLERAMNDAEGAWEKEKGGRLFRGEVEFIPERLPAQQARLDRLEQAYLAAKGKYDQELKELEKAKTAQTKAREVKEKKEAKKGKPVFELEPRYETPSSIAATISAASKLGFVAEVQTGAILYLGTQRDPIRFALTGIVSPPGVKYPQGFISLSGAVHNMIEFGWLAIGNAVISLDFDLAALNLLILAGIPVSGFFVRGQVDLGRPGESRASLKVGGGVSVSSTEIIDNIVFDASGENIRPADFVRYIGYLLMKSKYAQRGVAGLTAKGTQLLEKILPKGTEIPGLSLPDLIFHKVSGYASLGSVTIGGKTYRSGLGLQGEFELFGKKAGLRIFIGDQIKGYLLEGFGYGPPLSLRVAGRDVFKLYSSADVKKGPYITWKFNPEQLFELKPKKKLISTQFEEGLWRAKEDILAGGGMGLDGVVEIPALGLRQKAKFDWSGYKIDADFESQIGGFSIFFGINMNTRPSEIDEAAYDKSVSDLHNLLINKEESDSKTVAAKIILQAAEKMRNPLGMELLEQAKSVAESAPPVQSWTEWIKAKLATGEGWKKQATAAVKEGVAGLKKRIMPSESDPEQEAEVKKLIQGAVKQAKESVKEAKGKISKKPAKLQADWKGLLVTFGFENMDMLSKRISEQFAPYLKQLQESYVKKIEVMDAKIKRWQVGDIDPTKEREVIAARQARIAQMKQDCSKLPYRSQISCQARIKWEQSFLLKDKAILKAFVESKASRNIKRLAAIGYQKAQVGRALKAITESILGSITSSLELFAQGINILQVKEAAGQYSYNDMVSLKAPRLVRFIASINLGEIKIPIMLSNLQFDLKNPINSISAIARSVGSILGQQIQKQFSANMPSIMAAMEGAMAAVEGAFGEEMEEGEEEEI